MSESRWSTVDPAREEVLTQTFVHLAGSLVEGFDIIDLLTVLVDRCVELLQAAAAGIVLADADGALHVMAASSEGVRLLELFEVQHHGGGVDPRRAGPHLYGLRSRRRHRHARGASRNRRAPGGDCDR